MYFHIRAEIFCMSVVSCVTGIDNYYHEYVALLSQVNCRYIIHIIMLS